MYKTIVMVCIIIFTKSITVLCQSDTLQYETNKPKLWNYYFNAGIGLYNPINKTPAIANYGIVYSFQMQVNYHHNYFVRLGFDQYNIGYTDSLLANGTKIKMIDKLQNLNIGIDCGYTMHVSKKFLPYAYIGAGYANIETPMAQYNSITNSITNSIDIVNAKNGVISLRTGVGGEYEFSKILIASIELQYLTIPFKTVYSSQQLNGIAVQISFKTPLK